MKIILLKKIQNLGNIGEIVDVKNGFAKNYLLPLNKALIVNKENILNFSIKEKEINTRLKSKLEKENKKNNHLDELSIIIPVEADKNGKIYGSINKKNITKILNKMNYKINTNQIKNKLFIKKIGNYEIEIELQKIKKTPKIYLIIVNRKDK